MSFFVALVFLLQHNEALQLASTGSLVLVANYHIATHLLLREVQLHHTQRITIPKMLRCKVLYCFTLVVVAKGKHLYFHESVLGAICGSLYYHEVDFNAISGVLYCHESCLGAICGSLYYHEVDYGAIGGVLYCHADGCYRWNILLPPKCIGWRQ